MSYEYTHVNQLDTPCTYMYTPFVGVDFLREYERSRGRLRAGLIDALDVPGAVDAVVPGAMVLRPEIEREGLALTAAERRLLERICNARADPGAGALELPRRNVTVQTARLLDTLRSMLASAGAADDPHVRYWTRRLIARFEVSRRIYSHYQAELRGGTGPFDDVPLYAAFAVVLALVDFRRDDLKAMNALLKMNDLLGSLAPSLYSAGSDVLASVWLSAAYEQCAVARLMRRADLAVDVPR